MFAHMVKVFKITSEYISADIKRGQHFQDKKIGRIFKGLINFIIQLLGHCLATPQLVPISISFTRDWDNAYHVVLQ